MPERNETDRRQALLGSTQARLAGLLSNAILAALLPPLHAAEPCPEPKDRQPGRRHLCPDLR
jgi:hypothetical protein